MKNKLILVSFLILALSLGSFAQQFSGIVGSTPIQAGNSYYALIPISATASAGSTSTLTIPAPPIGIYNYICDLKFQIGNNNTGTVLSNVVSTSTNFNSFAVKVSLVVTNSVDSGVIQALGPYNPGGGCAKSAQSGTATTFVSSATPSNAAWTWYAAYYQAP